WRAGRAPLLDRGCVYKGFEGGSRLAESLRGAVELRMVEIAPSHHRAHFTTGGVQNDDHALKVRGAARAFAWLRLSGKFIISLMAVAAIRARLYRAQVLFQPRFRLCLQL